MTDNEIREILKKIFYCLNMIEIKGIGNADLISSVGKMVQSVDASLENRAKIEETEET